MRIECEKEALLEVSQAALRIVSPRANTPALGGVRVRAYGEEVEVAGSDLETFITVIGACHVVEEGAVVIPGRLFGEIVRSLPSGRVKVSGGEAGVRIQAGKAEFSLGTFPVEDFARPPSGEVGEPCKVPAADLAKALRQVGRAASTDEGRPVLTGILWAIEEGLLRVVATDSYRLAVSEVVAKEGPEQAHAIIPNRALSEFARHLGRGEDLADIRLGSAQAALWAGNVKLMTRLIDGDFPKWQGLIPERHHSRLEVDREELAAAVGRVALVVQPNTPVKFHLDNQVKLTAVESGVAEAEEILESAQYRGEPMVTAFNPRFFGDGLEGIDSNGVVLELTEPTKPATLRGVEQSGFTYLVMPVRLPG